MKKAQSEIIGLMIVVILVTLIFLIVMANQPSASDQMSETMRSKLASGFIGGLMESESYCNKNQRLREIIIDCVNYHSKGGVIKCENGQRSCAYAHDYIDGVLQETFVAWKTQYEFKTLDMHGNPVDELCFKSTPLGSGNQYTKPQPLPVAGGTMWINFCVGGKCDI